jgi:glycosyltransferase A (GT-A) superfamily protein (DUF2064 family)
VPAGALTRAFEELELGADIVLGPGLDGGYWLVAMRELHAQPFEDIAWSTDGVMDATLDRCAAAGLSVSRVRPWRDIDRPEDVAALAEHAAGLPGRRTAALLPALVRSIESKEVRAS